MDCDRADGVLRADPGIRFLLPVHLYGHAIPSDDLQRLVTRHGLTMVEDCAQAIGARSLGAPTGKVGAAATLSFYPTKNLGAIGDGGAVLTDDAGVAERVRSLRDYGQTAKYEHRDLGLNSRLDELQAAILFSAMLPRLAADQVRRAEIAGRYLAEIDRTAIEAPPVPRDSESVWHIFPILTRTSRDRTALQAALRGDGIDSAVHFPTLIPAQAAVLDADVRGELPHAQRFAECELSLPIHPEMDDAAVTRVIESVNRWQSR
jgi:dTDP-4-amino-4,6-dideoxygalactose transaminase